MIAKAGREFVVNNFSMQNVINKEIAMEHGISEEEYSKILEILGREPNYVELGIFSVMWSEHCSYKSSIKLINSNHIFYLSEVFTLIISS